VDKIHQGGARSPNPVKSKYRLPQQSPPATHSHTTGMHIKSPTANLLNANPQKWVKSPRAQNHTSLRILSPMSKNTQKSEIPNSVIQEIADCILKSSDFENLQKIKKYFNSEIKEEKSNR